MFCACCLSLLLYLLKWAQLLPISMTVSVVQVLCNSGSIFSVCVLSSRRSSCKIHVAAAVQLIQRPTIFELLEQFPRVLLLKQLFSVCLDCTSIFQPSDYFCCSFPSQLKANTKKRVVSYFRNVVDIMKKVVGSHRNEIMWCLVEHVSERKKCLWGTLCLLLLLKGHFNSSVSLSFWCTLHIYNL